MANRRELVDRSLTGDVRAFERLVEEHYRGVYAYAVRMTGVEAAEDVTQEVFLRAYRALATFRGEASFKTWVRRIAHNVCVDVLRRRRRERQVRHDEAVGIEETEATGGDGGLRKPTGGGPDPLVRVEELELEADLHRALAQLPDRQRAVVVLHDMHGFSQRETAAIVGCSVGTVKSRLHYARRALRETLRPHVERSRDDWSNRASGSA